MNKFVSFVEGKKTYAAAAALAIVVVAEFMGWIDGQTAITLYGLLGAGGLASLRAAKAK